MTRQRFALQTAAFALSFVLLSASAWADIVGTVWRVNGNDNDAGPTSISGLGTIGEGTFTASNINFDVPEGQGTTNPLSEFLAGADTSGVNGTALSQVMSGEVTSGTGSSTPGYNNTCEDNTPAPTSSANCYSTVVEVTGTGEFVNGTTYSVTHDDGVTLSITGYNGGADVFSAGDAGPTSAELSTFTFTGTTGNYSIDLWYMATNGNPEVLESDIVTTPEAGAISLLVTMLIGVAGFAGIFKKKLA